MPVTFCHCIVPTLSISLLHFEYQSNFLSQLPPLFTANYSIYILGIVLAYETFHSIYNTTGFAFGAFLSVLASVVLALLYIVHCYHVKLVIVL